MQLLKILFRMQCWAAALFVILPLTGLAEPVPNTVPLDSDHWDIPVDGVEFIKQEGFAQGLMRMKSVQEGIDPVAVLKGIRFGSGTIEFDVKPDGTSWPTIRFRKTSSSVAEEFYVRPGEDCAASDDCTQYAPMINGRMLWDSYLQYQHAAPFHLNEWNHIKMVISGQRMNVFFNHEAVPSLEVGELLGEAERGAVEFQGPATFANIVIRADAVENLPATATADPSLADAGYLRHWNVTRPLPLPEDRDPTLADMPGDDVTWQPVRAERFGMINLARLFGPASTRDVPLVSWLKTSVRSDTAHVVHVSVGFARRIVVFANGKLIYSGLNLYNIENARKMPDGRLNIDNDSFDLPLRSGDNQLLIGLSSNSKDMSDRYSFGLEFRINDLPGVTFAK